MTYFVCKYSEEDCSSRGELTDVIKYAAICRITGVLPNSAPCQIMHPLLVGLGVGVGEGLGLGVGLGLGNQVAISTRGCIIWQGCRFQHNTGLALFRPRELTLQSLTCEVRTTEDASPKFAYLV